MAVLTFVIEFEDGKEPPVHAHMEAFGGKVVAVAFRDALAEEDVVIASAFDHGMKRYAGAMQKLADGGD
ncbi:hypothetical protein AB4K05_11745 [Kluyvera sp. STS39-E]|uniref:hypothetical protein n=1 Tax=Kluyvera sp. STS39-E TaxID=3234748 RepID=UPI0034C69073